MSERGGTSKIVSYCRSCGARCGVLIDVADGRVLRVAGDPEHPLTEGFTCIKGRRLGDLTTDPARFRECQMRDPSGRLEPADPDTVVQDAAARLGRILEDHGPDAIAMYWGTHGVTPSLTKPWAQAWWRAIGSHKWFSTMTIDQAPKWVAPGRIGQWLGGPQRFIDSDVWLFAGTNPPVSMLGGAVTGYPQQNALRRAHAARASGMVLIVIDPRRTELAAASSLHLQLRPGTDAVLFAGLLREVLAAGLQDAEFCAQHVSGLDRLRSGVDPARPEVVASVTGVAAELVVDAARRFATGRRGMATTGTGANMGPWSNLVEHLAWCLNFVCGRVARAGDPAFPPNALGPLTPRTAIVRGPERSWETGFRSRVGGGWGMLFDELPTPKLPDEILEPGADRVRALLVIGGNPAASIPDQRKAVRALQSLDTLIAIEPFPTETAQLASHVLAPTLALERPEHTAAMEYHTVFPFAQYTPAVVAPPPGVREDWRYLLALSQSMGLTIDVFGRTFAPTSPPPTTEQVLEWQTAGGRIPLDEVRRHVHGVLLEDAACATVEEADDSGERLELLAPDVADELAAALADRSSVGSRAFPFSLIVRRSKETFNSTGRRVHTLVPRRFNPCYVHPVDLAGLGAAEGDVIRIESRHGALDAVCAADDTLRRGSVAMSHGFGDLPDASLNPKTFGVNPNLLLSSDDDVQAINAMPRMTAVPVRLLAARAGPERPSEAAVSRP